MLRKPRAGARWDGPACYIDSAEATILNITPGYYALDAAGKNLLRSLRKPIRLVSVDDGPGDPLNPACHYEVAAKGDPQAKAGRIVPVEAATVGRGEVNA